MGNQTIKLTDRNTLELTNAKEVISFNSKEFLIDTPFGHLKVLGKDLSIGKMDTEKKELTIKGNIDSLSYLTSSLSTKENKESVFKKLFK